MPFNSHDLSDIKQAVAEQSALEDKLFKAYLPRVKGNSYIFPKGFRPVSQTVVPSDRRHAPSGHESILIVVNGVERRFPVNTTDSDVNGARNGERDLANAGLIVEPDGQRYEQAVQTRLSNCYLDLGDVSVLRKLLEALPNIEVAEHEVGSVKVPGFSCGLTIMFDEDEHELLIEQYNSHGYGSGSLVQVTLSETNTLKPAAMLGFRKEITSVLGLDFSGDFDDLFKSYKARNSHGFDIYKKVCDNLEQLNNVKLSLPRFDDLLIKPSGLSVSDS